MRNWMRENRQWLFSGVAVSVPLAIIGWLWFQGGDVSTVTKDKSVHQPHSGGGDNLGGDKNVTNENSVRQVSTGTGDNVARDKIIHQYLYGSLDYQQLVKEVKEVEELLAGITPDRIDFLLEQEKTMEELKQRLRRAKAHFDKGEFREADAVLKAKEIQQDVEWLKKEKEAAIEPEIEYRSTFVGPVDEGEGQLKRAEEYFDHRYGSSSIVVHLSDGEIRKWQEPRADRMMTWDEANEYVEESNWSRLMNHDDWRLPSVGELIELKEFIEDVPNTFSGIDLLYWSSEYRGSSLWESELFYAFAVNLGDAGERGLQFRKSKRLAVRLVRSKSGSGPDSD